MSSSRTRAPSAVAAAGALGMASVDVVKTLVVTAPEGYVRVVLPASERIDLRKLPDIRVGGKKKVHLASEEDLARDGAVPRSAEAGATRPHRQPPGRARLARAGGGVARGVRARPNQRSLAHQRS
jgi:hypothetical protein